MNRFSTLGQLHYQLHQPPRVLRIAAASDEASPRVALVPHMTIFSPEPNSERNFFHGLSLIISLSFLDSNQFWPEFRCAGLTKNGSAVSSQRGCKFRLEELSCCDKKLSLLLAVMFDPLKTVAARAQLNLAAVATRRHESEEDNKTGTEGREELPNSEVPKNVRLRGIPDP
jgi:hypothetical protein